MPAPVDDIDVSSGSSISVETDGLFLAAAVLASFAGDARGWAHQAAMARCITEWSADAAGYGFAETDLLRCSGALQDVAAAAEGLGAQVAEAAAAYAAGEQRNADVSGLLVALGGFLAGGLARNALIGALPLAPVAVIAALVARHPEARRLAAVAGQPILAALAGRSELLADPAFVNVVRALVSAADDVALGMAGVEPRLAQLLGGEGAGIVGLEQVAGALLILAGRNAYTRTPITLTRSSPIEVPPPASLADAASRIPMSGPGRPQVRIEHFDTADRPSYAVYIGGTSDFTTGGEEPFDMASNLAGIAGDDAAAYHATLDAMERAGIRPDDRVALIGHSQGGLVAARIAASGAFCTEALLTFGSPSGQIPIPDGVAHVAVEHAEDITPALGGEPIGGAEGRERIVVTRALYADSPPPEGWPVGAHHMGRYAETAALADTSDDPRLDGIKEALARIGSGAAAGSATLYRAVRDR